MSKHTYDFGVIGNCAFLALIKKDTNVNWLCWPHFDSTFVFGSLLDDEKGGEFSIKPCSDSFKSEQYYKENTNVLCTEITYDEGKYRVTDFAPRFVQYDRYFKPLMLIRKIEPLSGTPRIKVKCAPMGEYGDLTPSMNKASNHLKFLGLESEIRLTTNVSLTYMLEDQYFVLNDTRYIVLTYGAPLEAAVQSTSETFLQNTVNYWRDWVKNMSISDFYQQQVIRSALVLKIHQFEDTGGIIASTTTSLPEAPGSGRNWDYRYCWLRDSYFVINALNRLGATKTMEHYVRFIINTTATNGEHGLRPVYRINGRDDLEEHFAEGLAGYRGMGPVRVGNQAYRQQQNDVYGSAILATAHLFFDERLRRRGDEALFRRLEALGEQAVAVYREPDAGPWEFRGFEKVHTFSAAICWAAARALGSIAEKLGYAERAAYWRARADEMAEVIAREAWNEERQSYTASFGGRDLDASLMLLYEWGFLQADDPRLASTVRAVEQELRRGDFLFRYVHEDDFGTPDTAFVTCAFWYVDALAAVGREEEARAIFERLLACRNHVGLLSEDIDPATGELWGNFPQTYSMVGLINSAMRLSRRWEEAL